MTKNNTGTQKTKSKVTRNSTANWFMNIFIFLLGVIIIYMSYSIGKKFFAKTDDELLEQNNQTASEIIQLEVLNGCGVEGVADKLTSFLRSSKYDVVSVSNYFSFDMDKSLVIDRTGNMANARKVAQSLGINKQNIVQQINDDYFLDVSVIIGKDYRKLTPYK